MCIRDSHHVVVLMRVLPRVLTRGKGPSGDPHVGVIDLHLGIHVGDLVPSLWSPRAQRRRCVAREPTWTSRRSATSAQWKTADTHLAVPVADRPCPAEPGLSLIHISE